jgi:hypothetical protein
MRTYQLAWGKRRVEKGLCKRCGKPNDNLPIQHCKECHESVKNSKRKSWREQAAAWEFAGLCRNCGKDLDSDSKYCKLCRDRKNANKRRNREKNDELRILAGLCTKCMSVNDNQEINLRLCGKCREGDLLAKAARYQRRKALKSIREITPEVWVAPMWKKTE